jgi:type I restriction enzyme S subunit
VIEGWENKRIEEIAKTTSGGTPSRSNKNYYDDGNTLWVKSGELNDNYIIDTEEKITDEAIRNSSAKLFPVGTVLIAMYGATVGKTAILKREATTNQAICGIMPNHNLFNNEFLRSQLVGI